MRQFFAWIIAPFFLFCTAMPPAPIPPDYLVTEITVSCPDRSPAPLTLVDLQTIGQYLQYLRSVPLQGQADKDSINSSLSLYTVRLTHATGRVTEYRQFGAEYLSKNDSPWYHIDPEDGRLLENLFRQVFPESGEQSIWGQYAPMFYRMFSLSTICFTACSQDSNSIT